MDQRIDLSCVVKLLQDQLAEQTSGVKIALARRLESLILENKALKQNISELNDQLAASMDISRVLNDELEGKIETKSSMDGTI